MTTAFEFTVKKNSENCDKSVTSPWRQLAPCLDGLTYDSSNWVRTTDGSEFCVWEGDQESGTPSGHLRGWFPPVFVTFLCHSLCCRRVTATHLYTQSTSCGCKWNHTPIKKPTRAHPVQQNYSPDTCSDIENETKPQWNKLRVKTFITFTSLQRPSRSLPDRCSAWCHLVWVTHSPDTGKKKKYYVPIIYFKTLFK